MSSPPVNAVLAKFSPASKEELQLAASYGQGGAGFSLETAIKLVLDNLGVGGRSGATGPLNRGDSDDEDDVDSIVC